MSGSGGNGTLNAGGGIVSPAYKGLNGSGSSANRIDILGRDNFRRPSENKLDARVSKNFEMSDRFGHFRMELLAEVFNVLNHQNITGLSAGAYSITPATGTNTINTLTFLGNTFGTYTNSNSNQTWEDRQIEIAARLHF